MVTIEEARQQLQEQKQQVQETSQKLQQAREALPNRTSAEALRAKFTGLQGREMRRRIAGAEEEIGMQEQELSKYQQEVIAPYEQKINEAEAQQQAQQAEQTAFKEAQTWYNQGMTYPISYLSPSARKYAEQFQAGYEANQEFNSALGDYNAGDLQALDKYGTIEQLKARGLIKVEEVKATIPKIEERSTITEVKAQMLNAPTSFLFGEDLNIKNTNNNNGFSSYFGNNSGVDSRSVSESQSGNSSSDWISRFTSATKDSFEKTTTYGDLAIIDDKPFNLTTGMMIPVVSAAPDIGTQYKTIRQNEGNVKGTISFLANKAVRGLEVSDEFLASKGVQGAYRKESETARFLNVGVPTAIYSTPIIGGPLLLAEGVEEIVTPSGRQRIANQAQTFEASGLPKPIARMGAAAIPVGEIVLGALGSGRAINEVEIGLTRGVSSVRPIAQRFGNIYRKLEGPLATEYGYLGRPRLTKAQALRNMPSTTYGLIGEPQMTQTRALRTMQNTEYGLLGGKVEYPKTNVQRIYESQSSRFGLIGASPEYYQSQNIKNAIKNANFELVGLKGEPTSPVRGYNYAKNQITQSVKGWFNKNVVFDSGSGMLGKSPEYYRARNINNLLSKSEMLGGEISPVEGYNAIKRNLRNSVPTTKMVNMVESTLLKVESTASKVTSPIRRGVNYLIDMGQRNKRLFDIELSTAARKYGPNIGEESLFEKYKGAVKGQVERNVMLDTKVKDLLKVNDAKQSSPFIFFEEGSALRKLKSNPSIKPNMDEFEDVVKKESQEIINNNAKSSQVLLQNMEAPQPTMVGGEGGQATESIYKGTGKYELQMFETLGNKKTEIKSDSFIKPLGMKTKEQQRGTSKIDALQPQINPNAQNFMEGEKPLVTSQTRAETMFKQPQRGRETQSEGFRGGIKFGDAELFANAIKQKTKQQQEQQQTQSKNKAIIPPILKKGSLLKRLARKAQEEPSIFEAFADIGGKPKSLGKKRSQQEAESLLKSTLKGTLRAGGFITKGGSPIRASELKGFGDDEFTTSKRSPFKIVQRKEKRLGTSPETKELQYFKKKSKKGGSIWG